MTKHLTLLLTTTLLLAFASCAKPKEYTCKVSDDTGALEECDKDMHFEKKSTYLVYSLQLLDRSYSLIQDKLDTKNIRLTPEIPGATCTLKEVHNTSLLEDPSVPKTYIYYFCAEDFQTLSKYAFTNKNSIFTENGITTTIVDFPKKYLILDNIVRISFDKKE